MPSDPRTRARRTSSTAPAPRGLTALAARRGGARAARGPERAAPRRARARRWRRAPASSAAARITPRRVLKCARRSRSSRGWLLSVVLFVISAQIETGNLPASRQRRAHLGRRTCCSRPTTILILGTDQRPAGLEGAGRQHERRRQPLGHDDAVAGRRRHLAPPVDPARHARRRSPATARPRSTPPTPTAARRSRSRRRAVHRASRSTT